MRMYDIIIKKRNGEKLTKQEINWMIDNYLTGKIPDYQMSAFTMAVFFNDMDDEERIWLTEAMVNSGDQVNLENINGIKVDKHSTGGVGDKTSLVLGPLVASCDVPVAKMSGRGLGHTGGTLDKLESIPNFRIELSEDDFINQVNDIKLSIIGQTANLCPADKKLYLLRDVTATVESIPLIASSIMSKKIASGADAIVLDVKFGSGAFMKNEKDAKELANAMVAIGRGVGRDTTAFITDMSQPLGLAVGNSLEVIEAIETLKGNGPKDLEELCINLGSHLLVHAKRCKTYEEAKSLLKDNILNGKALNKFKEFINAQGGRSEVVDDYSLLPQSNYVVEVHTKLSGYVKEIDALAIGIASMKLGAGRQTKEDVIDLSVGIKLNKKVGDIIEKNDIIAFIYSNNKNIEEIINDVKQAFSVVSEIVNEPPLIKEIIE